ncbi:hypothetical protein [Micromonospora chersina]|uniref:hypothetical protein n=1 Tax=Micromonospora chersina TaxID=47854 RepID=UPI0033B69F84
MNDNSMQPPDRITAAAGVEMDDVKRRLDATWDVEAGLRDILLDEHYQRFAEKPVGGFDVEAGLAAVLAEDEGLRLQETVEQVLASTSGGVTVIVDGDEEPTESTFDRVRRVGQLVHDTSDFLMGAVEYTRARSTTKVLVRQRLVALQRRHLAVLADDLELGRIELERALQVVQQTANLLLETYHLVIDMDRGRRVDKARRRSVYGLDRTVMVVREVIKLEQPIRFLFEPSDETVSSLR